MAPGLSGNMQLHVLWIRHMLGYRKVAFEFATRRGKKLPASWTQNKAAGYVWLHAFLKRTRLSLRMAESIRMAPLLATLKDSIKNVSREVLRQHGRCVSEVWSF